MWSGLASQGSVQALSALTPPILFTNDLLLESWRSWKKETRKTSVANDAANVISGSRMMYIILRLLSTYTPSLAYAGFGQLGSILQDDGSGLPRKGWTIEMAVGD